ncbi:MAG: protein kinase domain-containing protein [Polyangiales bacterium]
MNANAGTIDRWAGRRIGGKFRLIRLLGRGGMGCVYEAEDTAIGRRVAIKLLEPSARLDRPNVRRFVREARALATIHHPHVVRVYDACEDKITSALFIVQELLHGSDLRTFLAEQPKRRLSPEDAVWTLLPIAEALEAAHERGIIHCDVTPANVFIADVPKPIDFGLALKLGRASKNDKLLGTPQYMAPEQARGESLDVRADVWSFGAVLYRCLAGRAPYEVRSAAELLEAIANERLVPIDELADVSAELAAIVHRALDPVIDRRFRTMSELTEALRALTAPRPRVPAKSGERPARRLRFGVVFDGRAPAEIEALEELARSIRPYVALRRFEGYSLLVDALAEGRVDLAWLPPVAYVRAVRAEAAHQVFCVRRAAYRSLILARAEVRSLAGARAAWVSPWSAAGYLVPREVLRASGVEPDEIFRTQTFSGSYDAVLRALLDDEADVGAVRSMRTPIPEGLRVLEVSTDPIPGDTICASATLGIEGARAAGDRWFDAIAEQPALQRLLGAAELVSDDPGAYEALADALARDTRNPSS